MLCPQCGTQLPDGTKFCGNCGFDCTSQLGQGHSTSTSPFAQAAGTVQQQPASTQQVATPQYTQPQFTQPQGQPYADPNAGYSQQQYTQPQGQPYANPNAGYNQQQYGQPQGNPNQQPYGAPQGTSGGFDLSAILNAVVWPKAMPPMSELLQAHNASITQYAESQGLGMGFYKLVAWKGWAYLQPIFAVIGALSTIFGVQYGEGATLVYGLFPSLRVLNIVYAFCMLANAALFVYARMLLAQYKRGATETYLVFSNIGSAISVIYSFLSNAIVGNSVFGSLLSSVFAFALGAFVSYLIWKNYFGKRIHLFVN